MTWTDERVERLEQLWNDGYSASQIRDELDCGLSRNAVIGKVHRLGLSRRANNPPGVTPRPRKAGRSHQSHYHGGPKPQCTDVTPFKEPPMLPVEPLAAETEEVENIIIPINKRCSILELTIDNCHWPIGDPRSSDFFFCGKKSIGGLPYCGYHSRLAYQPEAERRRERRMGRG